MNTRKFIIKYRRYITMEQEAIHIRIAEVNDAEAILGIYAPYVTDTAITFEYEVPDLHEFTERIRHVLKRYPYLVAEKNDRIVGYAYASAFKGRAAYDWSVETSIYVDMCCRGHGVGIQLYDALEIILKKQNILNSYACIAYPNPESIHFHEKLGYRTIGHFQRCGYKLGTWYDMIWMEKMLGEHTAIPADVIPFSDLYFDPLVHL